MVECGIEHLYIFVGPPGAGKGSLSHLCELELGFKQLSTGNLCRWHILQQTSIGREIDLAIKSGKLVSDALVTEMVGEWLQKQLDAGLDRLVLDGYPRTVAQVKALSEFLKDHFGSLRPHVVRLSVSEQTVVRRLSDRYVCQNKKCQAVYSASAASPHAPRVAMTCDTCGGSLARRSDDEEASVRERLSVYRTHEAPLLEACKVAGWPVTELDVERAPYEIFGDLKKMVGLVDQ